MEYYPPPFFKQGPSALARLVFFTLLAVVLLVSDARWSTLKVVRQVVATLLYPLQRGVLAPVEMAAEAGAYLGAAFVGQSELDAIQRANVVLSRSATEVQQLASENQRLRELLELRQATPAKTTAAEILYDARDAFTRKVIINRGSLAGMEGGEPVLDAGGVVGQITRVFPFTAEVTLLTDKEQAIPVQIVRSGVRGIAYGNPSRLTDAGSLDLRFMAAHVDVREGDVLVTSGLDGVYPAGLAVARVARVERNATDSFSRIVCIPLGGVDRQRHVLVLSLPAGELPAVAEPAAPPAKGKG